MWQMKYNMHCNVVCCLFRIEYYLEYYVFYSVVSLFDNIWFNSAAYRSILRSNNSLHGPRRRSNAWISNTPLNKITTRLY